MKDYYEILNISDDADHSTIERAYDKLLEKYPADRFPEENSDIKTAYRMLRNDATIDACREFHRMSFASKEVYRLSEQCIREGRYESAAKILAKAVKSETCNDHLYYMLGIAYLNSGKFMQAMKVYDRLLKKYKNDVELLMNHTEACIAAENYQKAVISARKGYEIEKSNILFALYLVKGYVQTDRLHDAETVLKESLNNPDFGQNRCELYTRLAYVLSRNGKIDESLSYIEKLTVLEIDEDEKTDACEVIFSMLDFLMDNGMYREANRCMGVILKLMPEREDIAREKDKIEQNLMLEPQIMRFEEDENIPDEIVGLVLNELFPEVITGMTQRQKEAYAVMNEHQVLQDFTAYLMPVRYMKTRYPDLYRLKGEFFDELQDGKKRKILKTKNQTMIFRYQDVFEEMMDEWDEESDEDDCMDEEPDSDGADANWASDGIQDGKLSYNTQVGNLSNVRPFVRRSDRHGDGNGGDGSPE